jgi:hypothetical protein|eukprot:COSAG01_NODE_147_length_24095_cov_25.855428_22_plen_79_part_00
MGDAAIAVAPPRERALSPAVASSAVLTSIPASAAAQETLPKAFRELDAAATAGGVSSAALGACCACCGRAEIFLAVAG